MPDPIIDNGTLTDLKISAKTLLGTQQVQGMELVTAIEGGARTDLAKAEDSFHASGHYGIMGLGVRRDTAIASADADGDYMPPIFDGQGRMHVNIGATLAAARNTDSVSVAIQTDVMMNGLVLLTPKFKSMTIIPSTVDAVVVAAVTSKKIRVVAMAAQCGATATTLTLESDEATDVRIHKIPAGGNGGQVLPFNSVGWFETAVGSALLGNTGTGSDFELTLTYVEV